MAAETYALSRPAGAFVMSAGGAAMLSTDYDEPVDYVDDFLRLIAYVRATKPRDPFRAMEDALLDLRVRADS